jgi:hypothetical protein
MIPCRGRAHDRAISGHLRTSSPLLIPAPRSPTSPRSLAPSVEPFRPLSHYLPPLAHHRLFCDHRRARAPSVSSVSSASPSTTRETLLFALPLSGLPGPLSPERFLHSRSPPPSTRGFIAPPPFSKHPRVRTRGEQPSHAFILPSITLEPAQLLTGVSCTAAGLFPPRSAFSGAPVTVLRQSRVCRVTLNMPDPFPKPLEPRRGRPLVSGEPTPWDRATPPRSCPAPDRWISASVRDLTV